jgi:hypothetical protein
MGWSVEQVALGFGIMTPSAALEDLLGKLKVASYKSSTQDLVLFTSGSWTSEIIDSAGVVGQYAAMQVDSLNCLHISYLNSGMADLKYATNWSEFGCVDLSQVWVDDDWVGTSCGTVVEPGKVFCANAFAVIQDGVDAVNPGGTVNIRDGLYFEHIVIGSAAEPGKSNIVLDGESRAGTILDATQFAFDPGKPNYWRGNAACASHGPHPANATCLPGIRLRNVSGVTVRDMTIQNADFIDPALDPSSNHACGRDGGGPDIEEYAITVENGDSNTFTNLTLKAGLYNIFFWDDSDSNQVTNSTLLGDHPWCNPGELNSLDGVFSSGGPVAEGGAGKSNNDNLFQGNTISNCVFCISLVQSGTPTAADPNATGNQVRNNDITPTQTTFWNTVFGGPIAFGVNLFVSSNNLVEDNVIHPGATNGIRTRGRASGGYQEAADANNNTVTGNHISGAVFNGIWVAPPSVPGPGAGRAIGNTFTCNTSTANSTRGVRVQDQDALTPNIFNNNNIFGNTTWGLLNETGVLVNAENNWWGAADGPSGSGPGSGDAVSADVDFTPWLVVPSACAP